jgi:prepilin-type N-terminal cleavage/methylation domain-containing protein
MYNIIDVSLNNKGYVYMMLNEKQNNAPKGSVSVSQSVSLSVYKLVCRKITALKTLTSVSFLKTSKQAGFTLIELLVVVLIIGILAAIALPQYKQVVYNSKMKKMEVAMTSLYTAYQEYQLIHGKGAVPPSSDAIAWDAPAGCTGQGAYAGSAVTWVCSGFTIDIYPYIKGIQAYTFSSSGVRTQLRKRDSGFTCNGGAGEADFKKYCDTMGYPFE